VAGRAGERGGEERVRGEGVELQVGGTEEDDGRGKGG